MTNIEKDLLSTRTSCYVFDIDNTLADADHIILTKLEGYNKRLEKYNLAYEQYLKAKKIYEHDLLQFEQKLITERPNEPFEPVRPVPPEKDQEDRWDAAYFYDNIGEANALPGLLDTFIALALSKKVIILTARSENSRQDTIDWLNKVITERAGKDMFRRINFQLIFKPEIKEKRKEKDKETTKKSETIMSSVDFKKSKMTELIKQYNVQIVFEDDPAVVAEFSKLGLLVFSPNRGLKNIPS